MNFLKLTTLLTLSALIIFIASCGEDETTPPAGSGDGEEEENRAPIVTNQSFTIREDVDDVSIIGTVAASDPDGDALSYSITQNSDGLFEITSESGVITLVAGQSLDFETKESHALMVGVSDGELQSTTNVTIEVADVKENLPPTIGEGQTFSAMEFLRGGSVIGTVEANDEDAEDILRFSLLENPGDLFEITPEDGVISLQEDKQLNFTTASSHTLIVQVSDGRENASASVTITVTDVDDNAFVTLWEVEDVIQLPLYLPTAATATTYDFTVDWGDGSTTEVTSFNDPNGLHTYAESGEYVVIITGTLVGFNFGMKTTSRDDFRDVLQWGGVQLGNDGEVFSRTNFESFSASDQPDFTNITDLSYFFAFSSFNGNINHWDVSNITSMMRMFLANPDYNQDLSNWDVGNVTNMNGMFQDAFAFNQDITNWNVSNVTDMGFMFDRLGGAEDNAFNQDISVWDVSNVTSMMQMFAGSSVFDQDLSSWNVSNVQNMEAMFSASTFNNNISSWDVSNVTNMRNMFNGNRFFNQDITGWQVSKVTRMDFMFRSAHEFNQDISGWDVTLVTNMNSMFFASLAFDQDLSGWNTINVTNCFEFTNLNTPIHETAKLPTLGPCFGN